MILLLFEVVECKRGNSLAFIIGNNLLLRQGVEWKPQHVWMMLSIFFSFQSSPTRGCYFNVTRLRLKPFHLFLKSYPKRFKSQNQPKSWLFLPTLPHSSLVGTFRLILNGHLLRALSNLTGIGTSTPDGTPRLSRQ
jgi:hypothetical protein